MDASKGAWQLSAAASWAPSAVNAALTAANAAPSAAKREDGHRDLNHWV